MDFERPVIKIELSPADSLIEKLVFWGLAILWMYTIYAYFNLPATIPIHYNLKGEIDGYGHKVTILILPLVMSIVISGITFINKYPHYFNYSSTMKTENAAQQYTLATRLLRNIKLSIVIITFLICF